ncbi:hypothetical protein HA152_07490 [Prochlorococcus marinus XMU1412]|uniref:PIG-L family deacetylase n=1 Tax=Prochlorococcus marinus TaxID=1219 RepID=UPI001ADD28E2|nr:PIG-L family deacetylase [Prochlorococcus marinus]MBO8240545.1 hypothetical protein [Prochlorococcus marinus XMU1412]MBW3071780.1 hypothetical protein [Prochlorococcus marinus str. MU1412]
MNNTILVLCPHPDDEIFTFPFIKQFNTKKYKINALFFIGNSIRRKEAIKSCLMNNWQPIFASDLGYEFVDGCLHKSYEELDNIIKELFNKFDIILSPVIEGGHQDHDTIGLCTALNLIKNNNKIVYFYSTYTALGSFGLFSVMSNNKYSDNVFLNKKNNLRELPIKSLYFMFIVYKSQCLSWIFLFIPYIFNIILNRPARIFTLNYKLISDKNSIFRKLKNKPLYEIHKRCNKLDWIFFINKFYINK